MKFRPVSKRIDPTELGITDEDKERLDDATDEDGVIHLEKAFDVPPSAPNSGNRSTVVKMLEEKGLATEEQMYRKEYLLRGAHTLLINGASTAQIAQKLGISAKEAREIKRELTVRQINEVKSLDKNKVAGQALMFYDHIMAKALQIVNKNDPQDKQLRHKVEALKVALQAQTDKQKFLTMAGYWNNSLNGNQETNDKHISGANDVRDILDAVLSGDTYEVVQSEDDNEDDIELI